MSSINATGAAGLQQVMALRQQVMQQSDALKSLREAGVSGGTVSTGAANGSETIGGGFADTLKSTLEQVSAAQAKSSDITAAYERGEVTDVAQVMMARQESGVAFEATLQVRNKLLSAYQEIMRMGV
ncbi:flagellar hook-basal body complex protein FliE [Alteraurantiacibacter aquimixticola]|uniref:Flagellar hook-basal body complex protein FliE n=1 Tax=Alteraurantiacibacter aquimixticola TaxID=2489173 RepID=A0A4V4U8V5_9SPHN|nr:flagellar hook-basal body complex protein FliE [Alteraurantiacibacter aquimixticola]TIX51527.1 flagellar hook-basal body complex protein FliE [Alteraurantiacibacter aquimixticola]